MKEPETLADSFRQSRREFWIMVLIWAVFAAWTTGYNHLFAGGDAAKTGLFLGMPSWVVWGVALPWLLAVSTTIWFAMGFMKDTPLEEEGE